MPTETLEKTKEELALEEKKKQFEANPDDFIHLGQLVAGTYDTGKGLLTLVRKADRRSILIAQSDINFRVLGVLAQIEMEQAKKRVASQGIVVPGGRVH